MTWLVPSLYSFVPEFVFKKKRRKILSALLKRHHLYTTSDLHSYMKIKRDVIWLIQFWFLEANKAAQQNQPGSPNTVLSMRSGYRDNDSDSLIH
jgi:hypothetical protein